MVMGPGLQSLDSNSKLWSRFLAGRITASKIKTACYTIALATSKEN